MAATEAVAGKSSRQKVLAVFLSQGVAGFLLVLAVTYLRRGETLVIIRQLGPIFPLLFLTFFLTSMALQSLRFELTRDISVAMSLTAYVAMYPLLGVVISAWLAVGAGLAERLLSIKQIGPSKIDMKDPTVEYVKAFGFFSTYGIPVLTAALVYEKLHGEVINVHASPESAGRLILCGVLLIFCNSVVMIRPALAYGYSIRKIARVYSIDFCIYLLTVPYAICITLAYDAMGWVAVVALCAELIVAYSVTRKMAIAQSGSRQLLQRLASILNISKAISLTTTESLLMTVYTESKKVVDASVFSIAIIDEKTGELTLELFIKNDEILPKKRIPAGQGLNAWVIEHHEPLLLGRFEDEIKYGVASVDDGVATQSWLGVPMVARDRVIGVISLQNYRPNAFNKDDVLLLTTVANQAAVGLDNAQLYEELEDLTYALEERVQERTTELHETNVQLTAADRSKNEFLAKMSHELRTPLNSIIGFSSVLMRNSKNELPPRLYKFLENIYAAGHHLLNLINDILDLSKIEAGKVELRLDTFDLRETITAVERVMKGFAAEARVRIVTSVDSDVPSVRLDEGRLKQILFNLLSNAVKFSSEGETVQLNVHRVREHLSPLQAPSIRIDVIDDGVGIANDELNRIFDEFYQADQGRKSRKSGTGLGLSLTRNFVELHHGTIEVQSRPGAGSTFTLYLPVDCLAATRFGLGVLETSRSDQRVVLH
ncbi:MAG TPA: ATP-binding protein [Thermoanaerobaculia bacterium]|nr:ATP-binding protein [Thermoanaerobaculia bacterium]